MQGVRGLLLPNCLFVSSRMEKGGGGEGASLVWFSSMAECPEGEGDMAIGETRAGFETWRLRLAQVARTLDLTSATSFPGKE